MTKRPAAAEADSLPPQAPMEGSLPPWLKRLLSVLLALHVLAVFVPPLHFASRVGPGDLSPVADFLAAGLEPYYQAMYLDHGYFFFAPNPGPTHLVRYKVEFDDGREPVEGLFPELKTERPRLLYHRHFMMSEALNNIFVPPDPPPEPSPPPLTASDEDKERFPQVQKAYQRDLAAWRHARRQYESMRNAFEQHLLATHGGSRVTLTRVEHRPAAPWEVADQKKKLNDPSSYQDLPETMPESRSRPAGPDRP